MATSKTQSWDDGSELAADDYNRRSESAPHITTITARVVMSISVSMSITEMETLIGSFGKNITSLSDNERAIQGEFTEAVAALR